jgi:D-glycero-alpha-D-manno-heptose-7-phosphate kinase
MIITRTPYRLSFFGGGTDYNAWFEENGGTVLAAAVARYCYISVRRLPPFFEHKSRVVYSHIESVRDHADIQHPSVRGCLQYLDFQEGLEIHHDGDLPARSGIGSSSSFTVGLLHALHGLQSRMVDKHELAEQAIHVEQKLLCESVGVQDQIMAAHGGFQIIGLGPGAKWQTQELVTSEDYLKNLQDHVLMGFSGISRTADKHAKAKIDNIQQCKTTSELREIQAIAAEAVGLLKRKAEIQEIGRLLDKSWQLKRRLADGLSSDWMDDLYRTALAAGAYGGKLMGAGGGGFFFFLAPPERHQAVKEVLPQVKVWVPFEIDFSGSRVIFLNSNA